MSEATVETHIVGEQRIPKIDCITALIVRLPFVKPFTISSATWSVKDALLLRFDADGITAWGECVADPDPYYASETTTTALHVIREFLLPLVEPGITIMELTRRFQRIRGHEMAKATIENAVIDLAAKREGRPLHDLLGYRRRPIPSGISIGIKETNEELLDSVAEAVTIGYHRVKMKIKRGRDVDAVRAVRERFPALPLMADANGDYTLDDAEHLRQLDAFDLMMVEQPLSYSDVYEHSLLQREMTTPLCLDESIHNLADARTAIALGSCGIINVKQGRVGGLLEALRIADYASAHGVPVWSGGMDETGIGRAVNIHLQTSPAFTIPGDTSETRLYFHEDIAEPPVVLDERGFIAVPEGPGVGVTTRDEVLKRVTIASERLR